jgi:hypothetical protein
MCINFTTSLTSLFIGELSGLILTLESKEKRAIGLFVMFYSLVQFFEANIYYYGNSASSIYSRLLLLNLGFQGLIFFVLMSDIFEISSFYIIISIIIALTIMYIALSPDFEKATVNNCIKWNFLNDNNKTQLTLGIMYLLIFYWYLSNKTPNPTNTILDIGFINKTGIFFASTYIISKTIATTTNSPGIWCMLSAIVAPTFLLL